MRCFQVVGSNYRLSLKHRGDGSCRRLRSIRVGDDGAGREGRAGDEGWNHQTRLGRNPAPGQEGLRHSDGSMGLLNKRAAVTGQCRHSLLQDRVGVAGNQRNVGRNPQPGLHEMEQDGEGILRPHGHDRCRRRMSLQEMVQPGMKAGGVGPGDNVGDEIPPAIGLRKSVTPLQKATSPGIGLWQNQGDMAMAVSGQAAGGVQAHGAIIRNHRRKPYPGIAGTQHHRRQAGIFKPALDRGGHTHQDPADPVAAGHQLLQARWQASQYAVNHLLPSDSLHRQFWLRISRITLSVADRRGRGNETDGAGETLAAAMAPGAGSTRSRRPFLISTRPSSAKRARGGPNRRSADAKLARQLIFARKQPAPKPMAHRVAQHRRGLVRKGLTGRKTGKTGEAFSVSQATGKPVSFYDILSTLLTSGRRPQNRRDVFRSRRRGFPNIHDRNPPRFRASR